jgi:formate hydrogenlyase subunit 3/multisubunit Na+/H+ antiporter MnhD subunit
MMNLAMPAALIVLNVLRGTGDGSRTHVYKCSITDRFLYLFVILVAIVLTFLAIYVIKKDHEKKNKCNYQYT